MPSKNSLKLLLAALLALSACAADEPIGPACDEGKCDETPDESRPTLSAEDVAIVLRRQGLDEAEIEGVIDTINNTMADGSEPIEVRGILTTSGFNGGFFIDSDNWDFAASFRQDGELVTIPDLFDGYLENGGLALAFQWKYMVVLITGEMTMGKLDGAVYGRGLSLAGTIPAYPMGLEIAWLPGNDANATSQAFLISPSLGWTEGLRFPRLTFTRKEVE